MPEHLPGKCGIGSVRPPEVPSSGPPCRLCGRPLGHTFVDLGKSPLCESFLSEGQLNQMEPFFPLHVQVCDGCFLVQLQAYVSSEEIFREYAYYSSFSESWLAHARDYTDIIVERLGLGPQSFVAELASNDGYLLQNFVAKGIPCIGIEPARNVAAVAKEKGIPTLTEFFGEALGHRLVREGRNPDLLIGNNVLAQVPDLNDFLAGIKIFLAPGGVATFEFPHLVRLVEGNQFDTIYHEHFSYFSLLTTRDAFSRHGMEIFDVEELPTHGGSLRVYARHAEERSEPVCEGVRELASLESEAGLGSLDYYESFSDRVEGVKRGLLRFLVGAREEGKLVAGYGAPGKGNTLLNYCGIRNDLLSFTVDKNPYKQGLFLPGTHIPIYHPNRIDEEKPDFILILPWNLKNEIMSQMVHVRDWGARFVVPIPGLEVFD